MGLLDRIDHVVVLMLENRSFDCLLGALYPAGDGFRGLIGTEANLDPNGTPIPVWNGGTTSSGEMATPTPDPGELFTDMNTQLFGSPTVPSPAPVPDMSGFVKNYMAQTDALPQPYAGASVMHHFTPDQVPVLSQLARQFAVCDAWHASAPCQTWPNRFFVHTATAGGYENNSPVHFPYDMPTVFGRFDQAQKGQWRVYFHDMPQALTLSELWPRLSEFRFYAEFQHDARTGTLPAYSFIEPRYFTDLDLPNDQHPPHVVTLGEQLIADVYNNLRAGPLWEKTLLVITYDEHGGCYDHVAPPSATPPSPNPTTPFNFDRYGVRVPAVIVSPHIVPGTVLRPPSEPVPFDHTSIIASLRKRFNLGPPLTGRDAVAPDLDTVPTLEGPGNLGPASLTALPYVASPAEIATARAMPLNHHQEALVALASHLPTTVAGGDFEAFVSSYLTHLRTGLAAADAQAVQDIGTAAAFVKSRFSTLLRSLP